jgi:two-component system cell cycle response regulator
MTIDENSGEAFKVLVADDSAVYRKLVEQTLSEKQYSVLFAKSGREAMDIFGKHFPPLVITDWMMPDFSGIELCENIRTNFRESYTYIIILTGMTEKAEVVKGLTAGADDYLTKPFDREELLARAGVGRRVVELHRQIEAKSRLLEQLALTDALTNLPNRRAIEEWASRQLSGAARYGFEFWIVVADIDHFKSVNDTYGHEAGDIVLKRVAGILKTNSRKSDICGRIGGEEFLLSLTHTTGENAKLVIERIRAELEASKFSFDGNSLTVTASFGVACFNATKARDLNQIVSHADTALYKAKRLGRNRIEFSSLADLPRSGR